ncbi:MAG: hypothetical protein ACREQ7_21130 [Candidatus Binatia bacterium]
MIKLLLQLTISFLAIVLVPIPGYAHEGKLDSYGCHYGKEPKDYHCHEGVFKGGSFDSKIQMIRLLKLQFLNLGRPWPYGEIAEEEITSSQKPQ